MYMIIKSFAADLRMDARMYNTATSTLVYSSRFQPRRFFSAADPDPPFRLISCPPRTAWNASVGIVTLPLRAQETRCVSERAFWQRSVAGRAKEDIHAALLQTRLADFLLGEQFHLGGGGGERESRQSLPWAPRRTRFVGFRSSTTKAPAEQDVNALYESRHLRTEAL